MSLCANDDEAVGWTEDRWLVSNGKAKAWPVHYQAPINTCAHPGCNTPTSGVFYLPCTTK